jgi:SSS family solute:Na+ symporter
VLAGSAIAGLFVADQILGPVGAHLFPWLHLKLTFNYTYRGLWGTLGTSLVLFAGSLFTKPPDPLMMKRLTVDWKFTIEPFEGLSDWRLHCGILALMTASIYAWLW